MQNNPKTLNLTEVNCSTQYNHRLAATLRGSRPGCNPHRSLWRHWWRHNSETI